MHFYHEHYHGAYAATLAELHSGEQRDDHLAYEPISIPAIVNWLLITGVALLAILLTIHALV